LELGKGTHKLDAANDQVEVYLSNEQPLADDDVKADIAEIGTGNGYTGPEDVQQDFTMESDGTCILTGTDIQIQASGGTIGPFQFVVMINTTPTSPLDPLISWWDYGSAITLQDQETFDIDFGATIFEIS
jgi:hypothetical protein